MYLSSIKTNLFATKIYQSENEIYFVHFLLIRWVRTWFGMSLHWLNLLSSCLCYKSIWSLRRSRPPRRSKLTLTAFHRPILIFYDIGPHDIETESFIWRSLGHSWTTLSEKIIHRKGTLPRKCFFWKLVLK